MTGSGRMIAVCLRLSLPPATVLAWRQLRREPVRLAVATGGVGFAVLLVFMQIGLRDAGLESTVQVQRKIAADIVLISPKSPYIGLMNGFPRRRLYQALGFDGVASVRPLQASIMAWKHPASGETRAILVLAFDPSEPMLDVPELADHIGQLRLPDMFLFDRASRPEYGPVVPELEAGRPLATELAGRRIRVIGLFTMGSSLGFDGTLLGSNANFLRLNPNRSPGDIDLGLVRLRPGHDAQVVRDSLRAALPVDVEVLTKEQFVEREKSYWSRRTPIGIVFGFGAAMGLAVGAAIAYQILFTDVSSHLPEYATLKAMGYRNGYLFGVVIQQAAILAVLGFVPGFAVATALFRIGARATYLPLAMTASLTVEILSLAILMCGVSAAIALRRLRSADPADIF